LPDPCLSIINCNNCENAFWPFINGITNYTCAWCENLRECHYRDRVLNATTNHFLNGQCTNVYIPPKQCPKPNAVILPPPPAPILTNEAIAGTVVGGAFAIFCIIAAILAVLRLLLYLKDKKEYEAWEEEKKKSKWGDNPNPLFKKQEVEGANPLYNAT